MHAFCGNQHTNLCDFYEMKMYTVLFCRHMKMFLQKAYGMHQVLHH